MKVVLRGPRVNDEVMAALPAFDRLQWVDVSSDQVTDAGLAPLTEVPQLNYLLLGMSPTRRS